MVATYKIAIQQTVILFWVLVSVNLSAIFLDISWLRNSTKPLLMPALIWLILYTDIRGARKRVIISGLFFSWLGDVFLLFEDHATLFFIVGLVCFLITHACYIFYFLTIRSATPSFLQKQPVCIILVICYGLALVWLLFPYLGALKIPVVFYSIFICSMLLCSLHIYSKVAAPANLYFVSGSILFVLSDSILAINKFYYQLPLAGVLIMLSYCLAQYLIVRGFMN